MLFRVTQACSLTVSAKDNMNKLRNSNHPKKGSSTKVEPIRSLDAIQSIKVSLKNKPRDLCLFTFGINTAYRAGEILSLTIGQVAHLKVGDRLEIKQSKSGKYRSITLNRMAVNSIANWLKTHPRCECENAFLFYSQRSKKALTVSTVNNMVKRWCRDIGLNGNYGSHTLRKTWGYQQRVKNKQPLPLLMVAFGHTTQAQTLNYLCIQDDEIRDLFEMEL